MELEVGLRIGCSLDPKDLALSHIHHCPLIHLFWVDLLGIHWAINPVSFLELMSIHCGRIFIKVPHQVTWQSFLSYIDAMYTVGSRALYFCMCMDGYGGPVLHPASDKDQAW